MKDKDTRRDSEKSTLFERMNSANGAERFLGKPTKTREEAIKELGLEPEKDE